MAGHLSQSLICATAVQADAWETFSLVMDLSFEACWSLASDFYTLRIIIELNPLYWFMCRDIVK